jgi:hypothetical protein
LTRRRTAIKDVEKTIDAGCSSEDSASTSAASHHLRGAVR